MTQSPAPKLEVRAGRYRVYWFYNRHKYSVALGTDDSLFAERYRVEFAFALRSDKPDFSRKFLSSPAVKKYLTARYGVATTGDILADYKRELQTELTNATYVAGSISRLNQLAELAPLSQVTPAIAGKFLSDIAAMLSPASRNRALSICSRFYKWGVRTGRLHDNPFVGIKQVREERRISIEYCTAEQRDATIEAARSCGWPDWLAVPIALYTGMRRGEIERLQWQDVKDNVIIVNKTKTGRARLVPISKALAPYLSDRAEGFVVQCPVANRAWRLENLARHLRRMLPGVPCGWNVWRHTFGSLYVQSGVSLDKVCAWMGNTPEVCRRHYAQFVPTTHRDTDIDRV